MATFYTITFNSSLYGHFSYGSLFKRFTFYTVHFSNGSFFIRSFFTRSFCIQFILRQKFYFKSKFSKVNIFKFFNVLKTGKTLIKTQEMILKWNPPASGVSWSLDPSNRLDSVAKQELELQETVGAGAVSALAPTASAPTQMQPPQHCLTLKYHECRLP
jgi:hypothetical protein